MPPVTTLLMMMGSGYHTVAMGGAATTQLRWVERLPPSCDGWGGDHSAVMGASTVSCGAGTATATCAATTELRRGSEQQLATDGTTERGCQAEMRPLLCGGHTHRMGTSGE